MANNQNGHKNFTSEVNHVNDVISKLSPLMVPICPKPLSVLFIIFNM